MPTLFKAKDKTAPTEDPSTWCWTKDDQLVAVRAAQDEADARLLELAEEKDAAESRMRIARDGLSTARALRAAGRPADVSAAQRELELAEAALDGVRGQQIITSENAAAARENARGLIFAARAKSRTRFRAEYAKASQGLHRALLAARAHVRELEKIYGAASASFVWGSEQAQLHGEACGLTGAHGSGPHVMWHSLLANDSRPATGRVEDWAVDLIKIFGADVLPEKE